MTKKALFAALFFIPTVALASFPDVSETNVFYNAVNYVQEKGIVSGYPNGKFATNIAINRAEFVKIMIKTKYSDQEINACTGNSFSDVDQGAWYAPFVCKAKAAGIISGYEDGTFQAENPINFAEASKIISNTLLADAIPQNDEGYAIWYEPFVQVLSDNAAIPVSISGFGNYITRGDMAEMIYRVDTNITNLPSLTIDEVPQRELIQSYYSYISFGEYEKAYNMKTEAGMTLDEFKKLYDGFPYASPSNFNKIGPSTYEFTVVTMPNIRERSVARSERYSVKMQVIDGKLKTIYSNIVDRVVLEEVTAGDKTATLEWNSGVYEIYVFENGTKTLAVKHDTGEGISTAISGLAFSPLGTHLTYIFSDWEYSGVRLYDLESKMEISMDGGSYYDFTADDKHFYFCSESGMVGGEVTVVDFPGLGTVHHLSGDSVVSSCGPYDALTGIFHYQLQNTDGSLVDKEYEI